jgi:hypothetical protein
LNNLIDQNYEKGSQLFSGYSYGYASLIYLAIFLMQFQNIAVAVYGSRYDITSFILLFSIIPLLLFTKQKLTAFILLFAFITLQIIIWIVFQIGPFYRLVSGLVWFGGLLAISLFSYKGMYDRKFAYQLVCVSLFFLSASIIIDNIFFEVSRPKGFLDEPSYAGLILFSCAAMLLYKILHQYSHDAKVGYFDLSLLTIFLAAAALTKSMHAITFLLMGIIILYILRLKFLRLIMTFLLLVPVLFTAVQVLDFDHISYRLDLSGESLNISLLSWLRGLDQATYAFYNSPLFGFGLGSTGYFPFESSHTEQLGQHGLWNLNLTDAYSGLFRVTIELGFLSILIVMYLFLKQVFALRSLNKSTLRRNQEVYTQYLAIFSLSLLIGVLIKEPTYSRSYVYLGVFFLATNWFGGRAYLKISKKKLNDVRTANQ